MTADPDDLDELRRRLYRPDASADDLERYRASAGPADASAQPRPGADVPDDDPPTARRRRRWAPALLAVAVVAVVAAAGTALAHRPAPVVTPTPTTTSDSPIGITISASDRAAFVLALRRGGSADVLRYIYEHPDSRPVDIRTVSRADSEEYWGSGASLVTLSPPEDAERGGRITVALTVDTRTRATWSAIRPASSASHRFFERVATDDPVVSPGLPSAATFRYTGHAPTILSIALPRGVHWDAVVAFTD